MLDNRIYTFLAVCQEMNFTRAAKKLHITQPAVSQHIQYIERYYGVHAFRFEGKKLSLTPEGELLRSALLTMKNNEESLKTSLSKSAGQISPLRLGGYSDSGKLSSGRTSRQAVPQVAGSSSFSDCQEYG